MLQPISSKQSHLNCGSLIAHEISSIIWFSLITCSLHLIIIINSTAHVYLQFLSLTIMNIHISTVPKLYFALLLEIIIKKIVRAVTI